MRYRTINKAKQDYKNGKISEEEYRKILDECDYWELVCREQEMNEEMDRAEEEECEDDAD